MDQFIEILLDTYDDFDVTLILALKKKIPIICGEIELIALMSGPERQIGT